MADSLPVDARGKADPALLTLVELMFFAYRDFTGEPDAVLETYGLGRAHHRVLHFVNRHPGLRVADLLAILKITKQSLARVLKPLVDEGFVESEPGADRRERRLALTAKGRDLAGRLAAGQVARVEAALARDPENRQEDAVRRFLFAMISPEERAAVAGLLDRSGDAVTAVSPGEVP
jgi:DNA-binding MarR family transcriptional regulator